ncbi:MAG: hypothetical protein K2P58_14340 [Hyphomonadaceae bacterium]|nr:hypothetical protein [Hyphomonadaceae bacterium]
MRGPLKRWAAVVDRELSLTGATRALPIIRARSTELDQKTGGLVGFAGLSAAALALVAPEVLPRDGVIEDWGAFAPWAFSAVMGLLAAIYSLSALGIPNADAAKTETIEAFEFAELQRLAYRSWNFSWGLRSAQLSALGFCMMLGSLSVSG